MFVLINSQGLYLQQIDYNDYAFISDYTKALKFTNKEEADKKRNSLLKYRVKVFEVDLNL